MPSNKDENGCAVSLIIPAYNEEKRIESTLLEYHSFLSRGYDDFEIIVACDGCTDKTPDIVRDLNLSNVRLAGFPRRLGKGGGIKEGFKLAKGDIVGFVDADNSVNPQNYQKLLGSIQEDGVDCAIASRRVPGAEIAVEQGPSRRLVSYLFNIMLRLMFGLNISDTQCGAKAIKKQVLGEILPELRSKGYEFDVELLWKLGLAGHTIKEIPIVWQHGKGSTFSPKYYPGMFVSLVRMRVSKLI